MAGKQKVKLYQYSDKGIYLQEFESLTQVRKVYYNDTKYPMFVNEGNKTRHIVRDYHKLPDNTYIAKYKIGRDKLLKLLKIDSAPYTRVDPRSKIVEVYNLLGKKIANFASITIASGMSNIDQTTLQHRCERKSEGRDGLIYKYKNKI